MTLGHSQGSSCTPGAPSSSTPGSRLRTCPSTAPQRRRVFPSSPWRAGWEGMVVGTAAGAPQGGNAARIPPRRDPAPIGSTAEPRGWSWFILLPFHPYLCATAGPGRSSRHQHCDNASVSHGTEQGAQLPRGTAGVTVAWLTHTHTHTHTAGVTVAGLTHARGAWRGL